ncbi:hypothetical protein GGS24DRAFT_448954 [Hypoxylon argillaceum]|nr:hypothetical protein GGS24DRAFT_448954 [Hypoxylon argillaceum]KAI1147819.1 hypothetical protein F4825DRAFT_436219 [Nemania diffusa]
MIVRILWMFLAVRKCLPSCSSELDGSESKTSLCWQCIFLRDALLSRARDIIRVWNSPISRQTSMTVHIPFRIGSIVEYRLEQSGRGYFSHWFICQDPSRVGVKASCLSGLGWM